MMTPTDESWPMVEEAVFRLFDDVAAEQDHVAIDPLLAELGWAEIETEYPVEACALLFRAQGRSLAQTDALDRVMLAELKALTDGPVDAVVLPALKQGSRPSSNEGQVKGIVLGQLRGRVAVPVSGAMGTVSLTVVDADQLHGERLDTFDESVVWTRVEGATDGDLVDASTEWGRAVAAATARWPPNSSRWPTAHFRSLSNMSVPESSSASRSVRCSLHAMRWRPPRRNWTAPGRCLRTPGATAGCCPHRPPRYPQAAHTASSPTPCCRCAAPSA
jgi:hypothetical protein